MKTHFGPKSTKNKSADANRPFSQKKPEKEPFFQTQGEQNIFFGTQASFFTLPPAQLRASHNHGCNCPSCQSIQLKPSPTGVIQREGGQKAAGESSAEAAGLYAPTYTSKEFTTERAAKLLTKGMDENNIGAFAAEQEAIGKKYAFQSGKIPLNSKVKLVEEATSYDRASSPDVKVAKVTIVSVPEGSGADLEGTTVWTTRANISTNATDEGHYSVTAKNATIRTDPEEVMGEKSIPAGTKVKVTDVHYINDFPEKFRLKKNKERDTFHAERYMRLYLNVTYLKDGKEVSGWISANDVEGGFANEVLGTSDIADASLESNDPSHKTIGTATAPLLLKGGKTYVERKPIVLIEKGTYVRIDAQSSDNKYVKVTSENGTVAGEWTSVGNLDKSKKKEVEGLNITYYEVTDPDARIRDEKQGYQSSGKSLVLGDYVKVHSSQDGYAEISKVERQGDKRVEAADKYWIGVDYLADGWSTDLYGKNASWGVQAIGPSRLTKYKGQDDLVNLGGSGGKMKQVSKAAFPNLMKMINDAKNNVDSKGNADPVNIEINSCFRTYFSQKYYDDNENKKGFNTAASPGRSDHQDSNAFDLNNLRDPKVYTWLKHNAYKYDIVQNVQASNERHHWAYLPGKGKKGVYTTWGTKSDKSW